MLKIVLSNSFIKDLKILKKRGLDLNHISFVINKLASCEKLESNYRDHPLLGKYHDFRECHIKPDWLLIYCIDYELNELYLFRTGIHSDLF